MTNAGSLGRDAALHIPACVRSCNGAIWQAAFRVAAHGAVDAHKDHEKDVGAEAPVDAAVEKKADAATGACSSADAPNGAGVRKVSAPTPNVARALNPASARHCPAWPCAARFVRASYSAARLCPSRS
jgi:hypothetical protein